MDDKLKDLEREKDRATIQKEIAQQRAEEETLKAAERQAKQAYGGSGWQKVVGYVKGMTNSQKLQSLYSAGFGNLEHLREPNRVAPRRMR